MGSKRIETRSWSTAYRGELAIHAAKRWTADEWAICRSEPFFTHLRNADFNPAATSMGLPLSAIVCTCRLVDVAKMEWASMTGDGGRVYSIPSKPERSFGDYRPGRYAWILA